MKRLAMTIMAAATILLNTPSFGQKGKVQTLFKNNRISSGGYGAVVNKFTTIRGHFANISGLYGGWFINHRFMIGAGLEAVTNNLRVPQQFSADPSRELSYQYGQFGLVAEYVPGSDKPIHPVFYFMGGAGFTLQYQRYGNHNSFNYPRDVYDENWFFVAEPGVQIEMNLFKWVRFSPGISYRAAFGSDAAGMTDKDISHISYSAALKFGRF